ncbi:DNA-binding protein [Venturia nashicola]|uniref:DNA-binding protein n=1 Tax=Venturia nashicola TaxID=86259 RepID=A0A4Z1P4X0_9PEZI|nr:DNA-binding protein [Venturia nashicola]TLD34709.1 DNA-binding protein [Venturia nashicola]
MAALPNTFASIVANFAEFLTVAIHTIIWERGIYPDSSFIKAKKYNTPVRQSRHPKVCEFIQAAVDAVREQLLKGTLQHVCVVLYSPLLQALERFVFDVSKFPAVPKEYHFTQLEREGATQTAAPSEDLGEQFRAALTRLTGCGTKLSPLPSDCTFNVAIEVRDEADPPIGHPQPWIPTQPSLQRRAAAFDEDGYDGRLGSDLGGVNFTPIRAVDAGELVFEMWVEEGKGKAEAVSSLSQTSTQLSE